MARSRGRSKGKSTSRDAEILEGVFVYSPDGWRKLVERHGPNVRAVVRLVFDRYHEPVSDADVDEVVLEVFERMAADRFQWLRAMRSPAMLSPSVRALAAWRTLGLLRSKYRVFTCSLEAEAKLGGHHVATAVLARPPSRERAPYMTREDVDRLMDDFLQKVGDRPARVLGSLYKFKKPYAEIAKKNGMPLASVAATVHEERKRFADRLAEAAPEAGL